MDELHLSRLPLRLAGTVALIGLVLTNVFASAIAQWWLQAGIDGPGLGFYFLFMLLPVALVVSIAVGLAVAWWRRGAGVALGRAGLEATIAMLLVLTGIFGFQVWRDHDLPVMSGQVGAHAAVRIALVGHCRAGHPTCLAADEHMKKAASPR